MTQRSIVKLFSGMSTVFLVAFSAFAQSAVQNSGPATNATSSSNLLIDTDDHCLVSIDGREIGIVEPNATRKIKVSRGQHLIKASIPDLPDVVWRSTVTVGAEQAVVLITLKKLHVEYQAAATRRDVAEEKSEAAANKSKAIDKLYSRIKGSWAGFTSEPQTEYTADFGKEGDLILATITNTSVLSNDPRLLINERQSRIILKLKMTIGENDNTLVSVEGTMSSDSHSFPPHRAEARVIVHDDDTVEWGGTKLRRPDIALAIYRKDEESKLASKLSTAALEFPAFCKKLTGTVWTSATPESYGDHCELTFHACSASSVEAELVMEYEFMGTHWRELASISFRNSASRSLEGKVNSDSTLHSKDGKKFEASKPSFQMNGFSMKLQNDDSLVFLLGPRPTACLAPFKSK